MRTKSCSTISTLSSCSIDLHVGHGPPFFPPQPSHQRLRTVLVISFHQASRGALTNQLPASCWLTLLEATALLWQNAVFQSTDTALCLTCSKLWSSGLTDSQSKILFTTLMLKQLCLDQRMSTGLQQGCN